MIGKCPGCGEVKKLTKHSKVGQHKPPYKLLCRECHDEAHGVKHSPHKKPTKKIQPGTRDKRKKKK